MGSKNSEERELQDLGKGKGGGQEKPCKMSVDLLGVRCPSCLCREAGAIRLEMVSLALTVGTRALKAR